MITNIKLDNFKGFEHLDIKPARLTVLIGGNGTGKSSVLQALLFLKQSLNGSPKYKDAVDLIGFQESVFQQDTSRTLGISVGGSLEPTDSKLNGPSDTFTYEIEIDQQGLNENKGELFFKTLIITTANGSTSYGARRFKATWNRSQISHDVTEMNIGSIKMEVRENPNVGAPFFAEVRSRSNDADPVELESVNLLSAAVRNSIPMQIGRWRIIRALRGFDRSSYNLQQSSISEIPVQENLDTQGSHVASTLEMNAGRALRRKISEWVSEITGVEIDTATETSHQVVVQSIRSDLELPVNLVNEGTATSQLAFLMFGLAQTPRYGMVGIEEPESHLHPEAQNKLANLLVRLSEEEEKQLIMTTHSEHILFSLLSNVAEGKLQAEDLAVYAFERNGANCSAQRLTVTKQGMVEGGLPGFFEANLEAQKRHIEAMSKLAKQE